MTVTLFIIGALTSLGCGCNVVTTKASPLHDFVWIVGGTIGAVLMVVAVKIDAGCAI